MEPLEGTATGELQIHLMGFMGSGKSTVARHLARRLVWNYLDLDALVVRHEGASIAAIFADSGEAGFRRIERHVLRQAVQKPRTVVALGGGTPVSTANREVIGRHAMSVWLRVGFAVCRERVAGDDSRPLFADLDAAHRLFTARAEAYATADFTVEGERPAAEVAAAIERLARYGRP